MHAELVAWSDDAELGLKDTFAGDRDAIRRDVEQGAAQLWRLDNGNAWMVTRAEGQELVVMCFQGANFRAWMRELYQVAKSRGYKTARFHTRRPALARLVPFPTRERERVFTVEIA